MPSSLGLAVLVALLTVNANAKRSTHHSSSASESEEATKQTSKAGTEEFDFSKSGSVA
jgi:hypothetical protein